MAFCQGIFQKLPSGNGAPKHPKNLFFAYFRQIFFAQIIMFTQTKCTEKPNIFFILVKINYLDFHKIFEKFLN